MQKRSVRIMAIYGTRPEAIKMAPVIRAISGRHDMEPVVAVTGQHREMLDQVNELFGIAPDYDLNLMKPGASLTNLTSETIEAVGKLIEQCPVDAVLVQGDTTSAFAAAMAAFLLKVPVIHLEAGLRTGDLQFPFPEEGNRKLITSIASLHLAPTAGSRRNLLREGVGENSVFVTGNTVIDALFDALKVEPAFSNAELPEFIADGRLLLVTTHRRESWGKPMRAAMRAVRSIAESVPDVRVLVPMHRNEIVREVVRSELDGLSNVLLTESLEYHDFVHVMNAAAVVLTDSGGVQEEAPSLGVPVLVLRETTERPEAVSAGGVRLVGTSESTISRATMELFASEQSRLEMAVAVNPYGDGDAAARVVAAIASFFGMGEPLPDFTPAE